MMRKTISTLHRKRFELFFFSLTFVLFGDLLIPRAVFHGAFFSIFLLVNLLSGVALVMHNRRNVKLALSFFALVFILVIVQGRAGSISDIAIFRYLILSVFYALVSFELIRQVWKAEDVSGNIILGMMSGFMCIGLLANFVFFAIEVFHPGSFAGIPANMDPNEKFGEIMNFSFVTLLTVGYGNVSPVSMWAQKMAVITALVGQFYMVIVTGVVIGKFLQKKQS